MLYQFRAHDGEVIERPYPVSEAPELGSFITEGGKQYKRIASIPQLDAQLAYKCRGVHNTKCYGVEQWQGADEGFNFSPDGVFTPQSLQEKHEHMRRYGYSEPEPDAV